MLFEFQGNIVNIKQASLAQAIPAKSIPRQVIEGAISEGFLEELPQSISEQIIQNLALGKDWSEGVEDAAVMGTLAGMAMGGGASLYNGMTRPEPQDGGYWQKTGGQISKLGSPKIKFFAKRHDCSVSW